MRHSRCKSIRDMKAIATAAARLAALLAAFSAAFLLAGPGVLSEPGVRACRAEVKIQALVIGNNRPPEHPAAPAGAGPPVEPVLRFADDDAAAFYELVSPIADSGHLLTVMDRDTQALY